MIKTRIAPSPTGFLHVGNLRTALFCYLYAKKNQGQFFIRVEDTDRERLVEGAIENMLQSLHWVGIIPDEGVDYDGQKVIQKGDKGPYVQSERLDIYQTYINQLIQQKDAYHCFCSRERLEELRKVQELNKQPVGYDGHCRSLASEFVEEQLNNKTPFVIRMKMPKEGTTTFTDLVRGDVTFENKLVDDQVLMKTDGFPTYHFAVVVDDHLMGTSHVMRGEEWISSTPKHITLYKMFGWEAPQFAHLSLLVNEEKKKLSKRHGDVFVNDFKEKGYLPEALLNFIAFLGWNPGTDQEIFSLDELIANFDFSKVSKAPAVFNREKLNWFNKQYLTVMSDDTLVDRALPFFINSGLLSSPKQYPKQWLSRVVSLEKTRSATLVELVEHVSFIFADSLVYDSELLVWKKSTAEDAKEKLVQLSNLLTTFSDQEWNKGDLETKVLTWIKENEFGVGDVLWPTRVALSGQKNSPGPFEIMDVLGKEKTLSRLNQAISLL